MTNESMGFQRTPHTHSADGGSESHSGGCSRSPLAIGRSAEHAYHRERLLDGAAQASRHLHRAGTPEPSPWLWNQTPWTERLSRAIRHTADYLLSQQADEGYWVAELEGDSILESEFILLLAYLGREAAPQARQAARYLLDQQQASGGWSIYPGGTVDPSATIKAYLALKATGYSADSPPLVRARRAIREAGGLAATNSFTRFYLALLGQISYESCPAVCPELTLLPCWLPLNLYEMSAWTRTIVVPLSILYSYRPVRRLSPERGLRELWADHRIGSDGLPILPPPSSLPARTVSWDRFFYLLSETAKLLDRHGITPLRRRALQAAEAWMIEHFRASGGLGAIFPPMVWSVIALRCRGYPDDHPHVRWAMEQLQRLIIEEDGRVRLQPCFSPIWDTAITMVALRESGLPADAPSLQRAGRWLLAKQTRERGDWSLRQPELPPGGWYFEFENEFYPDIDDTSMVLLALARCSQAAELYANAAPHRTKPFDRRDGATDKASSALHTPNALLLHSIWDGQASDSARTLSEVESSAEWSLTIDRGLRWMMGMQNRDGGWAAFDVDIDRQILTRVPFADHNAILDPSTPDITGRVLELLGLLGVNAGYPPVDRAVSYLFRHQCRDGSWFGRWGVNYIYGTWQVLMGLRAIGVSVDHPRIQRAAGWLLRCQQPNGAWGESCRSYDDPDWKGRGDPTASQTAWALMGLMAAGLHHSEAVQKGIDYLLQTQLSDGTWEEPWFTGAGFPRVFYLKYHFYRVYFPLMALSRYAQRAGHSPIFAMGDRLNSAPYPDVTPAELVLPKGTAHL